MLPQRMCAVCRERHDKAELLRIVKSADGKISVDYSGKLQGRGMYVCKNAECIKNAAKRRVIERAFSCSAPKELYDEIEGLI
ncbi:MAG: YlxR family protein [Clostridia bacterium]|nr:YlxR family protein [Clostridia bacterium]